MQVLRAALVSVSVVAMLAVGTPPLAAKPAAQSSAAAVSLPKVELPYERFVLPNGLRVIVHTDRKAPLVAVHMWYHVGSKNEPKGRSGFAHLFEHLMFTGTQNFNSDPFRPLEEAGATDMNGTTWFDRTNYFQTVPTSALDMALFIESERMGKLLPVITQEKLDKERGIVLNEKRQGDNSPFGLVEYRILEGLFPEGHPYRISTIGTPADLNAATLDTVKDWFNTFYGPNNAVLVLAGDIDAKAAKPLVEKWFGDIPAGPPVARLRGWVPQRKGVLREEMADRIANSRIYRVWAVPGRAERDMTLLSAAADALGGGTSSRLVQQLVYQEQLAVGARAYVNPQEVASFFQVEVDVRPGVDPAKVEARLDTLIAEFLRTGPNADELKRSVIGATAGTIRGLEKVGGFGGKASALAEGELYADNPGHVLTKLDWLAKATPTEVRTAGQRWLSDGAYALLVRPHGNPTVAGGGADRSKIPAVAQFPSLTWPKIERASLSNGIQIVLAERRDLPLVSVALQFDAGNAADPKDKLGLSSLTLGLLDEGTDTRTALQIAEEEERLGASIGAGAGMDSTSISLSTLSTTLAPSLALFADVVRNPAFRPTDVERARRIQLAHIAEEETEPQAIALRTLPPILYGAEHPYGVPFTGSGTVEGVAKITRADLVGFHQRWLRPDNATLFVVGDVSMAQIKPLLEAQFGTWKAPATPKGSKAVTAVTPPAKPRIILIDKPGAEQSYILAGTLLALTGKDDRIDIDMVNDVLGGQFFARINSNLRERRSWSYGAYSSIPGPRGQRPFMIFAPVQTDKTADSIREILSEMKGVVSTAPATAEERARVIGSAVRSLPGQYETARSVLGTLMSNAAFGRPDDYAVTYPSRVQALSADDFAKAMREIVRPESLIWLVVGDRSKVEAPLKALGIAEVEVRK
jgi:zinc protease